MQCPLWNTVNSGNPGMGSVSYSVCAIGDTSYDEFCKAGLDWDEKLASLSAKRVHDIVLCDVDFDAPWQVWVHDALSKIACVDESGTLLEDLVPEMIEYASDTGEELDDGDFTPGAISKDDIAFTLPIQILRRHLLRVGITSLVLPQNTQAFRTC